MASVGVNSSSHSKQNKYSIHEKPLPLSTYPLPAFVPHNPLSLLRIAYVLLSEVLYPPSIHPHSPTSASSFLWRRARKDVRETYTAYLDPWTGTVQVTDSVATRALWERGFFGKGSLSRSEPEWTKRVLQARAQEEADRAGQAKGKSRARTAAEVTEERRRERREAKRERARKELHDLDAVLAEERGTTGSTSKTSGPTSLPTDTDHDGGEPAPYGGEEVNGMEQVSPRPRNGQAIQDGQATPVVQDLKPLEPAATHIPSSEPLLRNEEHLQLAPEEVLFLAYGLGIISVTEAEGNYCSQKALSTSDFLRHFCASSTFPPKQINSSHNPASDPANRFLLSYTVYHHFRSLGWVVRPGVKFSVDFLLYARGPVFAHAQFAVMILPSFSHPYWSETEDRRLRKDRSEKKKDWWWLHCVNRVQTQVLKSLVLCYVDIPPPLAKNELEVDIGALLRSYRIREFVVKRWSPQRDLK